MPRFFIDGTGNYYETMTDIVTPAGHTSVPQRPGPWDTWDGAQWLTGTAPPFVPADVTKLQLVRACRLTDWGGSDLWTVAKAALAAAPAATQEDWDLAVAIPRSDPGFVGLATALALAKGLSEADAADLIDGIFILAATL